MGLDALAPPPLAAPKAAKVQAATIDKEMAARLNDNVGSAQVQTRGQRYRLVLSCFCLHSFISVLPSTTATGSW